MKKNPKVYFFLFLLYGFLASSVEGRNHVELPNFDIGKGLSNNSVNVLFQDDYGFLWIGTEDGLNKYDGYGFKIYRHDPSNKYSIAGNHIQAIVQDDEKNLWIGTLNGGLSRLDYSTGKFYNYFADSNDPNALPENGIYGLLVDNRGRLWVKTQTYLSLFKGDSIGFENFGHFDNVFNVQESSKYPLVLESDTSILVGTKDGLNRFNTRNKHFTRFSCLASEENNRQESVFDVLPYNKGVYLVATSSGLQILEFSDENKALACKAANVESLTAVNDILQLQSGEVFLGTATGLKNVDVESFDSQAVEEVDAFLDNKIVTSICQDKTGIIWIGTRYNGLYKLNMTPSKFKTIPKSVLKNNSISSLNIQSVFQDDDGALWLGTIDSGIFKYNLKSKKIELLDFYCAETSTHQPNSVFVLKKDVLGKIWAGTNCGLFYFSPTQNRFVKFSNVINKRVGNLVKKNQIFALQDDLDGNLWIGARFGLYRFDGTHLFSYFYDSNDSSGLLDDRINSLCADERGNIWIGTASGLNVWDRELKQIKAIGLGMSEDFNGRIPVLSLNLSYRGSVLVGTRSGVYEVVSKDSKPRLMSGNDNLENDMIKAVVSDNTNRAWVATNKGISCLNPDGTAYNFDLVDGLPGYVFNQNSVFKNRSGTMFFGSTDGLCWFHPDSINYNLTLPPLAFTSIEVIRRGEKTESYWPQREAVEIKYRPFTSVEVEFSALEFTQPSKNKYKVFLQGYDSAWRPLTNENKVSFSNLLPGEYVLKIIASNNDFTWNNTPHELNIIVNPPLYLSNYAFAFYILAVIFIIHLFINYRVRHYRKANKELQEKNVNKKQIEAQREVLTRINRSLTDSINYARRIQRAMIPSEKAFAALFPQSFVYLRARDIVSGDFFWFHEQNDKTYIAAVDCTGHGVPGAFMSIIGIDLLKNIIEIQGVVSPSEILRTMNAELIRTLHKEQPVESIDGDINDGMDMSLLVIDRKTKVAEFAGAYNGFYLVRDNEILTFKGDRFPVGYLKDGVSPSFSKKEVQLQNNDILYLFSDGLPDQFGGPDHKKFKYRRFRLLLLNIHRMTFRDQKNMLHQKIEEWMNGENEQVDDMLVVGFKPYGG
ncbi:ligand-binding sensor domain-containing protein [Marinilabilia rubra]|uniref:Serine/threonine protein phosphatase n=1 Tax=Marinilabilia rubra TaxID=2162893 RepID=A0A2U2BE21_9BACT|nr:two-component regulator propeller domain-containing protein [Marinilabilia rubra]PWE01320.1 serine/threonine protein phosphatase [Marinilabilia rubra]